LNKAEGILLSSTYQAGMQILHDTNDDLAQNSWKGEKWNPEGQGKKTSNKEVYLKCRIAYFNLERQLRISHVLLCLLKGENGKNRCGMASPS
jgi:hypothetical protein